MNFKKIKNVFSNNIKDAIKKSDLILFTQNGMILKLLTSKKM